MRIKVTSQNAIPHSEYGLLLPGKEYDVASLSGIRDHVKVIAQEYGTKVIAERPILADGTPLSALPAAQVSQEQTVTRRRRGRRSAHTED